MAGPLECGQLQADGGAVRYLVDQLASLRATHVVRAGRRPETAIDVQTAWYLCDRMRAWNERQEYVRILDLGSGFSSVVFRWYMTHLRPDPRTWEVWTTDHDWRWLGTALYELEDRGLDTRHMLNHEVFTQLPARITHGKFDLVFLDLADTARRVEQTELVQRWRQPRGIVVLDDWHMEHYRELATPKWADYDLVVREDTTDQYGRYVAEAYWPPSSLRAPEVCPTLEA